jgi:hypothetical protein
VRFGENECTDLSRVLTATPKRPDPKFSKHKHLESSWYLEKCNLTNIYKETEGWSDEGTVWMEGGAQSI